MKFSRIFAPMAVPGGIIAALVLVLALVMWRANTLSDNLEQAKKDLTAEETRHSVTRGSLQLLETKMAELVEDGQLRAEARDRALAEVAKETEQLRDQAKEFDIKTVEGL